MIRSFNAPDFHQRFDTETGVHMYFGEGPMVDPEWCRYGPNLLDIELSAGKCYGNCKFCYKDNGAHHETAVNMSCETFVRIFEGLNKDVLTQIAFGICDIDTNPEMWEIFTYCRINNIVPNFTCNGLRVTDDHAARAKELCGAVAVSIVNKEQSYNAIEKFCDHGMKQVNIHFMLSQETYDGAMAIIDDIKTDLRLSRLNAIVFLQYKPKGNGVGSFHSVTLAQYQTLVLAAERAGITIGFDSCSAPMFLQHLIAQDEMKKAVFVEPCESGLFSGYINANGDFFPCSFAEGTGEWEEGIPVLDHPSFKDVWDHPRVEAWRKQLLSSSKNCGDCKAGSLCRSCTLFPEVTPCKNQR